MIPQVVIDTNVLISALRSNMGASFKLLSMIDKKLFQINLSVPLVLEYEASAKMQKGLALGHEEVDDIIDYMCSIGNLWKIFYLWRPMLRDPQDDMVLEVAVRSNAGFIITFNGRDFSGAQKFNIKILTPREFLKITGVSK